MSEAEINRLNEEALEVARRIERLKGVCVERILDAFAKAARGNPVNKDSIFLD